MKYIALTLMLVLAGCGKGPLSLLTGGGPDVSTNVQAGKENTQQVVAQQTKTEAGRDIVQQTTPVSARDIGEVNIQQTPLWIILLLILGWLLPSPNEIARWIRGFFR